MNTKNTQNAPSYNAKLYETCQYMIQNSEQFKDYALYKNRMSLDDDHALELHNSLKSIFNFLTGNGTKKSREGWAKGTDVMAGLMLEELPKEKLAMILVIFYEHTHENRKATEQIFNINVEKNSILINALIEKLNYGYIDSMTEIIDTLKEQSESESIEETDYAKVLDIVHNIYKTELINDCKRYLNEGDPAKYTPIQSEIEYYKMVLLDKRTSSYLPSFQNIYSLEKKYPQFGNLKDVYYTWLYVDLCCHALLEPITFLLTNKELHFSLKELEALNTVILELIQEYPVQRIEAKGSPEEILFYFSCYYDKRDRFLQDTNILKYITDNCGRRENPKPEYAISIPWDLKKDFSIEEIKELFTEGKETRTETFRKNYEACKSGIDEYNKKTRRNILNNLISQKAMYREIYMDSTLYKKNRHKSKHIFSDFLRHGTMNSSDYYFLNEKINMGMYREYGLIDEFYAKNELQENLYHLISLILSRLYPDKIIFILNKCLFKIYDKLFMITKDIPLDPEVFDLLEMQLLSKILEEESSMPSSDI